MPRRAVAVCPGPVTERQCICHPGTSDELDGSSPPGIAGALGVYRHLPEDLRVLHEKCSVL